MKSMMTGLPKQQTQQQRQRQQQQQQQIKLMQQLQQTTAATLKQVQATASAATAAEARRVAIMEPTSQALGELSTRRSWARSTMPSTGRRRTRSAFTSNRVISAKALVPTFTRSLTASNEWEQLEARSHPQPPTVHRVGLRVMRREKPPAGGQFRAFSLQSPSFFVYVKSSSSSYGGSNSRSPTRRVAKASQ
jgi:hypothetical protein